MIILTAESAGPGPAAWTAACDRCGYALDPGERASDDGPWSQAAALSAAERRGWYVTADVHLCPVCWPTTTLRIDLGGVA